MAHYPIQTRRNCSVEKAKGGFEHGVMVWIAGRIIGLLDDGFVLQDESGRIDINYELEIRNYKFEVGDIVEVKVESRLVRDTNGKEYTAFVAQELAVLVPCKADFFISKDSPNYLKMVIDQNLKERLKQRTVLIQKIRQFFCDQNFIEVETPALVKFPGMEPYLDVFKTQFISANPNDPAQDMYLNTSPEYALKKLLVAGYEKIFQITKSFRNKETGGNLHNPEFTMIEWYRAYASYEEIMQDMEGLVFNLARFLHEKGSFTFNGLEIDCKPPWPRLKVKDAFKIYAGVQYEDFEDLEKFRTIAQKKGYNVDAHTPYEDVFFMIFMNEVESKLGLDKPVILFDYPAAMAALSKKCLDDPRYAQRFEVYIAGMELCNAFTELNDPVEQRQRLEFERKERQKLGKDDYPVDQSFVSALEFGMPPSGGIALGVDRLIMLLTNTPDIRNILFFPHQDL